jgi:hypothetical protein
MTAPAVTPTMTEGRKKFLHYVFTTAMEGGIRYWAQCETYHWVNPNRRPESTVMDTDYLDLDGFSAKITSIDGGWGTDEVFQSGQEGPRELRKNEPLRIDAAVINRGVIMMVDKVMEAAESEDPNAQFSWNYLRQFVIQYLTDGEDGDSDATVCDWVVQLGLFGAQVYG